MGNDCCASSGSSNPLRSIRINPAFVFIALLSGVLILLVADDLPDDGHRRDDHRRCRLGRRRSPQRSMGVNMRINRRMAGWSPDAPPAEFSSLMDRWQKVHVIRDIRGRGRRFVGYVIAVLARDRLRASSTGEAGARTHTTPSSSAVGSAASAPPRSLREPG